MTQYPLRLPDYIMEQAKAAAEEDNVSVNQLLGAFIAEGLGHRRGVNLLRDRAQRADIAGALALLDTLTPDASPDAGDALAKEQSSRSAR